MPNGKAAGLNKIPYEAWKYGNDSVHSDMVNIFNQCLTDGKTPKEWLKSRTIMIPKPKHWRLEISNLRPICLIDTMRKIFTKILTNRLEEYVRELDILKGNNCSILKRTSTRTPIATIRHILDQAKYHKGEEVWIALQNMTKAYNSISWLAMQLALEKIDIP